MINMFSWWRNSMALRKKNNSIKPKIILSIFAVILFGTYMILHLYIRRDLERNGMSVKGYAIDKKITTFKMDDTNYAYKVWYQIEDETYYLF